MKKLLLALASLLLFPCFAKAQTTLQVTDTASQTWNNGTWFVQLTPPPTGNVTVSQLKVNGANVSNPTQNGSLSSSGAASITLTTNSSIAPSGSTWYYTVCPNATSQCFSQSISITTSNQAVTLTPPPPIVNPGPGALAYADSELNGAIPGSTYYNTVSNTSRICNGPSPCTWGSVGPSNGAGSNPLGAYVNIKGGGSTCPGCTAVGDTKFSRNCVTSSSSAVVTNPTDTPWTAADVGKHIEIISPTQGTATFTFARTIKTFTFSGSITLDTNQDGPATPGAGQLCKWATQDDTAAFVAAHAAAKGAGTAGTTQNGPTLNYPSGVYCPPGGYTVSGTIFLDVNSTVQIGTSLIGDPDGHCVIYPTVGWVGSVDTGCSGVKTGLIDTCQTERTHIENISVEGSTIAIPTTSEAASTGWLDFTNCKSCTIKNNKVYEMGLVATSTAMLYLSSFSGQVENNYIQNGAPSSAGTNEAACEILNSQFVQFKDNLCSNHASSSTLVSGSGSRGSTQAQILIQNELNDECSGVSSTPCFVAQSGSVVNIVGGGYFGGVPELMSIDGTSSVYIANSNIQAFGSPASNVPTVAIANGGFLEATGTTFASNGTSAIFNGSATATYVSAGGNKYLNCLSGTCAAITAATYSNYASGGIVTKSSETHSPNTCYAATGTLVATQNLCTFLNDQNYQVLNITAQSGGNAPSNSSCATAPVVTLSDGTRTATLTLTTGKTQWSSAVDVSTVNSVFATGTTLTVSVGTFTCATPPTNLAVSYVLQSVLNP